MLHTREEDGEIGLEMANSHLPIFAPSMTGFTGVLQRGIEDLGSC